MGFRPIVSYISRKLRIRRENLVPFDLSQSAQVFEIFQVI